MVASGGPGGGLKFIVGSEMVLADGLKLVVLACKPGRLRQSFGPRHPGAAAAERPLPPHPGDLERRSPWNGGIARPPGPLELPGAMPAPGRGLAGRAFSRPGLDRRRTPRRPDDGARIGSSAGIGGDERPAGGGGGDVHMHVRPAAAGAGCDDGAAPQDHGSRPVMPCSPMARHLRSRLRLSRLYPPEWLAETLAVAGRCDFPRPVALRVPGGDRPRRRDPGPGCAPRPSGGWPGATRGVPAAVRPRIEHELALIAELGA